MTRLMFSGNGSVWWQSEEMEILQLHRTVSRFVFRRLRWQLIDSTALDRVRFCDFVLYTNRIVCLYFWGNVKNQTHPQIWNKEVQSELWEIYCGKICSHSSFWWKFWQTLMKYHPMTQQGHCFSRIIWDPNPSHYLFIYTRSLQRFGKERRHLFCSDMIF